MESLQSRRRRNVDVGQKETGHGNHLESHFKSLLLFFLAVHPTGKDGFPDGRIMVNDVRPHANHIDIHIAIEQNIVCQVTYGLTGKADHIPRPDLIADASQTFKASLADRPLMVAVIGMKGRIEVGITRLDAQQIAVSTGFKPASVGIFCLFTDAEGQSQFAVAQLFDIVNQAFDVIDKSLVLPFTGLDGQRAVLIS